MNKTPENILRGSLSSIISFIVSWKFYYQIVICSLLVMYPIFVSDGQSWKFIEKYNALMPLNYTIHGIDISKHNGEIDWTKINDTREGKNLIKFVFIKATEGTDLVDQNFKLNWENSKKHGLMRGAYHFFNPHSDPKMQALNFILNVKFEKGDFVPVLDFENNAKSAQDRQRLSENVKIWLDVVEKHTGKKPIIYTNKPIYKAYIKDKLIDYPLWISDFFATDLEGFANENVILWQHSDSGRLNGIKEYVDFNVFLGTPHKLDKFVL